MNLCAIKLSDLNPVNLKSSVFTLPGRIPLSLSVVESVGSVGVLVGPWLAANAVREVGVGAADSQIKNNVKFSVKGGSIVLADPGVVEALGELTSLEEAFFGEVNFQHLVAIVVKVGVKSSRIPVETVDVEVLSKGFGVIELSMSSLELILIPVGTPMKSGSKFIVTASRIARTVTTRLHDVDFTRSGPVSVLVVLGKQPNCGPQPVALRELSSHLKAAILECE